MTNQKITVGLEIQSNTAKETTQAERLGAALKSAADSSQRIKVPAGGAAATSTGVGAVMAKSQPVGAQAVMEYGQQRGAAGATGAAARDFAAQSQGLGGLVRLYATYAANIYAAGAAFRALSEAMNTANMVRGLDQIGASSGKALGSLSKRLVEATDGAISLREAMTAVAQTSASGMTSNNILKLGTVAQKASQALGVNMSDALSRLSRGITKIEPELLDELGIFVKVDMANEKYARSLGKTVSALTEFERRQAFANEVLDQANTKFGKIDIPTNPYDKLAASIKNLSLKALDLVNVGLGPVIKLLAESPTALAVALAGIGAVIVKTALPAIGQFKEGLKKGAQEALVTAATASSNISGLKSTRDMATQAEQDAEKSAEIAALAREKAQQKFEKLRGSKALARSGGVSDILSKNIYDIGTDDVAALERAQKAAKGNKQLYNSYKEIIAVIKLAKIEEEKYQTAVASRQEAEEKLNRITKQQRQQEAQFKDLGKKALISNIIQSATNNEQELGFFANIKQNIKSTIDGYKALWAARKGGKLEVPLSDGGAQKFDIPGIGKLDAILGSLKLSFATAYGWASKLFGIFARGGPYLAAANIGFEILDSYMSGAQVQSEKFSKSMEILQGSIKNAGDTVTAIFNKKPSEIFSIESLQAQANALNDLGDSLKQASQDFSGLLEAQNGWDRAKMNLQEFVDRTTKTVPIVGKLLNKITSFTFGKGARVEAANSLADTLINAVNLVGTGPAKDKIQSKLSEVIGFDISSLNSDELKAKLAEIDPKILASKFAESSAVIDGFSKSINNSASSLTSFKDSVGETVKQFDNLITSLAPTDLLGRLGTSLLDTSAKLTYALKDPQNSVLALKEVVNNTKLLSLLPPELSQRLMDAKQDINALTEDIGKTAKKIQELETELSKGGSGRLKVEIEADITKAKTELAGLQQKSLSFVSQYATAINNSLFQAGIKNLDASFKFAGEQAGISIAKAYLSNLDRLGVKTAEAETRVKNQEAASELNLVRAQYNNAKVLEKNNFYLEKLRISQETIAAEKRKSEAFVKRSTLAEGDKGFTELTSEISAANAKLFDLVIAKQTLAAREQIVDSKNPADTAKRLMQGSSTDKDAAAQSSAFVSSSYGVAQAEIKANAQIAINNLEGLMKKAREEVEKGTNKQLDAQIKSLKDTADELTSRSGLTGIYDAEIAAKKFQIEQQIQFNELKKQENLLNADAKQLKIAAQGKQVAPEKIKEREGQLTTDRKNLQAEAVSKSKSATVKYYQEVLAGEESLAKKQRETDLEKFNRTQQIQTLQLTNQEQQLDYITKVSDINQTYVISEQNNIALAKQAMEYAKEKLVLTQRTEEVNEMGRRAEVAYMTGAANAQELSNQYADAAKQLGDQKRLIESVNNSKVKGIELNTQAALEQERYNRLLQTANTAAESIQTIFSGMGDAAGRIGAGLADMTKAFIGFAVASERGADALADIAKNRDDTTKTDAQRAKYAEQYNEQLRKNTKDELTGTAQIIGSAKKMFKEKSVGYKALGVVEKALHVARLAMDAKELAGKLANVATELAVRLEAGLAWVAAKLGIESKITFAENAGFLSRMGTYVTEIFAKFSAMLGPFGMAAAAAVIAAIGLRGGGRKAFKPTIDQQIETQGTGQTWNSRGQKVNTGGGVFGDSKQKADSIASAIDIIKENSDESLLYDNKALAALEKMVLALDKTAVSLYRLPGFVPSEAEAITNSKFAIGSTGVFNREEILGSTIKFTGTLDELAAANENALSRIDTIKDTTTLRFLGAKVFSDSDVNTVQGTLPPEIRRQFGEVFKYGREAFQEVGKQIGREVDTTGLRAASTLTIKPGMTGEELATELNAVTSETFNTWAKQLFPEFQQFQKFGEEYLETVVRVGTTNRSVNSALRNLTVYTTRFADIGLEATEAIKDLFGGTQETISAFNAYGDSMFTEQQQMDRKRANLAERLNKLGLQDIKTRAQYNAKVEELIRDGKTNTDTFRQLILLAPQFGEVVDELADKINSAYDDLKQTRSSLKDILQGLRDFRDSLNKTIMSPGELYLKAKTEFETLAQKAAEGDYESARKISTAGETFRAASSTMFASSDQYVADVKKITAVVDSLEAKFAGELTDAEKALGVAEAQDSKLADIVQSTDNTYKQIKALYESIKKAEEPASQAEATNTVTPKPPEPKPGSWADITSRYYTNFSGKTDPNLLMPSTSPFGAGASSSILTGVDARNLLFSPSTSSTAVASSEEPYQVVSAGATGSNYIAKDQMLYVHKGERLMPAADNRELMRMVNEYSGGGGSEMYAEICRLTKQVEQLTKVVADGAIMNAKATDRNTEQLATTIQDTAEAAVYNQKLQNRTAIV